MSASVLPTIDRLTLGDDGDGAEVSIHEAADLFPHEELLRLDDGTPLPPQLAELRALLQLHSSVGNATEATALPPEGGTSDESEETTARLAELAAAKAEMLRDCLLDFDESMLILHDKLLDHEALCKRLQAARRRNRVVPAGKLLYDEAVTFDDDDDGGGGGSGSGGGRPAPPRSQQQRVDDDDDDECFDLSDLLKAERPGGAGPQRAKVGTERTSASDRRAPPSRTGGGGADGGDGGDGCVGGPELAGEDEEALEQKVIASRHQIKTWLKALEEGKTDLPPRPHAALPARELGGDVPRVAPSVAAGGALPPVRPPPKAKESSFSMRLRKNAATWSQKTLR